MDLEFQRYLIFILRHFLCKSDVKNSTSIFRIFNSFIKDAENFGRCFYSLSFTVTSIHLSLSPSPLTCTSVLLSEV